jgi:hypothetical protein
MYKYVVFQDPNWDWKTLNWDSDIEKALKATAPMLTAYPKVALYKGTGSTDDANNFVCAEQKPAKKK